MALPSFVVPAIQAAFAAEGIPPSAITPQGDINWALVISSVVTDVEVRTTIFPPYRIHLPDALKPAPPNPVAAFLKPTLIMSGPQIGTLVTAPYGEASGSWVGPAVAGGVVMALAAYWFTNRPRR